MVVKFHERTGDSEPSGRFGVDLAEWTRTYVLYEQDARGRDLPNVTTDVLTAQVRAVTGTTLAGPAAGALGAPAGAGSLARVMPMADPQVPGLFAELPSVRVPRGDLYVAVVADGTGLAVPPLTPGFSQYNGYEFVIPFTARPYAVLPNSRMVAATLDWYDVGTVKKRLTYYPEWYRFVQTLVDDVDVRLSASVGSSLRYRVPSGVPAGVDGSSFTGIPDMIVPDQRVILRWYGVPLRYLTSSNSFLVRYKGRINHGTFSVGAGRSYVPGSLLYLGPKTIRTYTPPQFDPVEQDDPPGFPGLLDGTFYEQPLVDLELNFIFTARRRFQAEAYPFPGSLDPDKIAPAELADRNWIDGPHNWMPHFNTRRYFYAHASTVPADDTSKWVPYYFSVPFEILWQDPDVPGVLVNV